MFLHNKPKSFSLGHILVTLFSSFKCLSFVLFLFYFLNSLPKKAKIEKKNQPLPTLGQVKTINITFLHHICPSRTVATPLVSLYLQKHSYYTS